MTPFEGFNSSETFTPVPDALFRLLGEIDDLNELKLTLYVLWRIEHIEGAFRQICRSEIAEDDNFMNALTADGLDSGLQKAVHRGTLIRIENPDGGFYFLNSPRGRASADAMRKGDWRASVVPSQPPREIPNVFKLYEENIGPLTPLIAEALKDAEKTYAPEWIADAIEQSVKLNKRNWKYIDAILRRWKEEGRAKKQNRRDTEARSGSDVTRKVEEFLNRKR
ncbi:MAG: DnaD domain protein [Chloroflexi bacterium]|nr:DnaD domain protein [Chloroflexota bacterium]